MEVTTIIRLSHKTTIGRDHIIYSASAANFNLMQRHQLGYLISRCREFCHQKQTSPLLSWTYQSSLSATFSASTTSKSCLWLNLKPKKRNPIVGSVTGSTLPSVDFMLSLFCWWRAFNLAQILRIKKQTRSLLKCFSSRIGMHSPTHGKAKRKLILPFLIYPRPPYA